MSDGRKSHWAYFLKKPLYLLKSLGDFFYVEIKYLTLACLQHIVKNYLWEKLKLVDESKQHCPEKTTWQDCFPESISKMLEKHQFSSVKLFSHVQLFVTPWITAHQASLSISNSWSLLKLMSIESVMPSSHLILYRLLLLLPPIPPSIRVFPMSQLSTWGGQNIRVTASASVLPMNTQDWSPLGWTGWIQSLAAQGTLKSLLFWTP